jgi:two-component system chemotaxis response regulator CheY
MKVLLVEDSAGMRGIIHSILTKLGFSDIVEAEHGGQAWDLLRSGKIDLMLTDWNMPVVDGL